MQYWLIEMYVQCGQISYWYIANHFVCCTVVPLPWSVCSACYMYTHCIYVDGYCMCCYVFLSDDWVIVHTTSSWRVLIFNSACNLYSTSFFRWPCLIWPFSFIDCSKHFKTSHMARNYFCPGSRYAGMCMSVHSSSLLLFTFVMWHLRLILLMDIFKYKYKYI